MCECECEFSVLFSIFIPSGLCSCTTVCATDTAW